MIDIQAGDVVVCVARHDYSDPRCRGPHRDEPTIQQMYRVTAVATGFDGTRQNAVGLHLSGMNHKPYIGYHSRAFRKVKKADQDFTEYMRKMRPVRTREPA